MTTLVNKPMTEIKPLMDVLTVFGRHYQSLGDYSVTQLIDTPRRVRLIKKYPDRLIVTPESQAAAFVGVGVHNYWEHCLRQFSNVDDRYQVERKITVSLADRLITGKFDILWNNEDIYDVKTCKVWKLIHDPEHSDWVEQQNIYAYLLGMRGLEIKRLYIIAQLLDWIKGNAIKDRDYPQAAVQLYELPLWSQDQMHMFLHERIALHKSCEDVPDDQLPLCSRKERWERHPDGSEVKYAVMVAKDAKRAVNKGVCNTLDEAIDRFKTYPKMKTTGVIEVRYAYPKRCVEWCSAAAMCSWYREWSERERTGLTNDYYTYDQIHNGTIC